MTTSRRLCLFLLTSHFIDVIGFSRWIKTNEQFKFSSILSMSSAPTTYVPVQLNVPKAQKKATILVKNANPIVIEAINSWKDKESIDMEKIDEWMQQGLAFWLNPQGTRALHIAESKASKDISDKMPKSMQYSADVFVNTAPEGSEDLQLVSARRIHSLEDIKSGEIDMKTLERAGDAFTNISMLFTDRKIINRADDIATRLSNDFHISSPQWKTWVNRTASYNATTLGQAFAYYFQEHTAGDIGGKSANYVPKKGYPGTLAPGEFFKDTNPVESLPNR
eukprot:gene12026-25196_t